MISLAGIGSHYNLDHTNKQNVEPGELIIL